MSLADTGARGAAVTLTGQLARFLVQILSVVLLSRLIDPSDFGLFTMVVAIVGIAAVLGDFGLSLAAIQSQTITNAQRSNLFWTNSALGLTLCGAMILLSPAIAALYGQPELVAISQVLSVAFLLNALTAQFRAEVTSKLRFTWLAVTEIAAASIALGLAVALAVSGFGYWALVAQQLSMAGLVLIGMVIGARWIPGLPSRGADMGPLYRFGANTLGVQLFSYATSNIDSILIGRFWGAGALGVYSRAYQLFRLPLLQIAAPMTKVAIPILSRLQDDRDRFEAYVRRAQVVLSYVFAGTFFMLTALTSPIIDIALGPGWDGAKPLFAILALGGVFQGVAYVYYWVFMSRALTGLQLRWTIVSRTLMVAMMCIGVIWGPVGVAVGSTAGLALSWALFTAFPMAHTGVARKPLLAIALRPIALFTPITVLALFLSLTLLRSWNPWAEAGILVVLIAVYLSLAMLIAPLRRDVVAIWDVVQRARRH